VAQGIGAGAIPAVAYTTVGRAYPQALRPRLFAVVSTAWVVPGLVGPAAASALAAWMSWRLVFLSLLPLTALAALLALPVLADRVPDTTDAGGGAAVAPPADDDRRRDALVLVAGVALVLAGLGSGSVLPALTLAAAGAVPAVWAFVRLVPEGTLALHPGLPAAVAIRGLLTFAFLGTDAFVSLAVTEAHDEPTWVAGLALTGATLTWTAAAWVQQRLVLRVGPRWLVRRGFVVLAVGIAALIVALGPVPVGLLVAAWTVAGFGIGLAYAPLSVTVLSTAAPGQEGRSSASLQLSDVLGVALGTGVGGVVVALGDGRGWATASSLTIAFLITLAGAVFGVFAAGRLPRSLPEPA
jgi:MFS family permease